MGVRDLPLDLPDWGFDTERVGLVGPLSLVGAVYCV
jgi:hypothetical protein